MNTQFNDFPQIFKEMVDMAKNEFGSVFPLFEYGTYFELMQKCTIRDNNQEDKYPLLWLVWDQNENKMNWIDPYIYTISPRIFICAYAKLDDSTKDRYENTIKPVLFPIFNLIADWIQHHPNICYQDNFNYDVKDHPFWLNNAAGNFDTLSAIEIQFQNLTIYKD